MDALVDLTGGLAEWYDVHQEGMSQEDSDTMFKRLLRAFKNGSYFTCNRSVGTSLLPEGQLDNRMCCSYRRRSLTREGW